MIDQTAVADLEPGTLLRLSRQTGLWRAIAKDGGLHGPKVVVPAKGCVLVLANVHQTVETRTGGVGLGVRLMLLLHQDQVGWVTHATASQRLSRW